VIFQFFFFNKCAEMSTILCFSVKMVCCVYNNEGKNERWDAVCPIMRGKMNLNDFREWLQNNKE